MSYKYTAGKLLAGAAILSAPVTAAASASPIGMTGEIMDGSFMLQFLVGLGVVVLCIIGLAWLLKRAGGLQSSAHGALRVIDGVALSTRERLVLVQVGEEQVLLGVAPGRVNRLHVLAEPLQTQDAKAGSENGFAARLREAVGREQQS